MKALKDLAVGESCTVKDFSVRGSMLRRFMDIGLIKNTKVSCVGESPSGDPKAYLIRGAVIAIRSEDAEKIAVEAG